LPTGFLKDRGDRKEPNIKRADVWVSHGNSRVVRQLQSLVREVMSHASRHSGFESTLAATQVEAELSRIAAKVTGRPLSGQGAASQVGRPVIPRDEIIRRCKQLLSVDSTGQVRIEDLLSCAHVSERTLRLAFKEYFGVGPTRYLQLRQLHQVRQTLKKSAPESTTVTNVLFDAGIWQLGRFATKFRQLFGETPSETLRARSC
jgi:AraC family ethanolamine operon transcriptional activator